MANVSYISVILPLKLEWEPCYSVTQEKCEIGSRVRVRFAGKEYIGVVSAVGIKPETEISRIKPIDRFEDGMGNILPSEIELWRRIAEYYMCTIGEVYKAAYPIGKINLEEQRAAARKKEQERRERKEEALAMRLEKLDERLLKKKDLLNRARKDSVKEKYVSEIEQLERTIMFLRHEMSGVRPVKKSGGMDDSRAGGENRTWTETKPQLTERQLVAKEEIEKGFRKGRPVLLNGVTGSGKTEIYITLAQEMLAQGKNVLYMVPEISLSRQLEDRLRLYFGDRLMTFHSRETSAAKRNTAERIRSMQDSGSGNYIVLGTRSSLFLPHHSLGLIIVDEEHDSSYKQDSPAPRYNGRDTALILSVIQKCRVILGSATPSLEELYNCKSGRHIEVVLPERYHGSEDSEVEIINTLAERRKNGMKGSFSRRLIGEIEDTLSKGQQVIILRARRSWAPVMQCESCGELQKCPHCNVSLSLHKSNGSNGKMVCHWCGFSSAFSGKCSGCGGTLIPFGAGTQRIEEEAEALFPNARIARLDSDTVQNRNYEAKTINEFSEGKIDILIGTQIVTKGFDFSGLQLVAVIAADSLLGIQDFRADEKALQLLQQLRGRSGRRTHKGKFIIQTAQPEHPVYARITDGTENHLTDDLLEERRMFGFPPYSRIIELTVKDKFEDRAERMAQKLSKTFKGMNVTGPYSPVISRVSDWHIRIIRLSLAKDNMLKSLKEKIRKSVAEFEKANRYDGHISINVDPS